MRTNPVASNGAAVKGVPADAQQVPGPDCDCSAPIDVSIRGNGFGVSDLAAGGAASPSRLL